MDLLLLSDPFNPPMHFDPFDLIFAVARGFCRRVAAATQPSVEAALGLLYPAWCQACDGRHAHPSDGYVCRECQGKLRLVAPPFCRRCGLPYPGAISDSFDCENCRDTRFHFEFARAASVANPFLMDLIHRYKYRDAQWLEPYFIRVLTREASPFLLRTEWDLIVPVPLHPIRRRERGFNQAERLARPLALATGIPLNTQLVRRIERTNTQTALSRVARTKNVRNAFERLSDRRLDGLACVVFDDVLTTGATTSAVAKVLKNSGAARVCVWSLARASY